MYKVTFTLKTVVAIVPQRTVTNSFHHDHRLTLPLSKQLRNLNKITTKAEDQKTLLVRLSLKNASIMQYNILWTDITHYNT